MFLRVLVEVLYTLNSDFFTFLENQHFCMPQRQYLGAGSAGSLWRKSRKLMCIFALCTHNIRIKYRIGLFLSLVRFWAK